ncbi:MAG TPA: ribonuclease H-like domain-containing protein [Acidobacteriota bacterium]|nr:ribonuclease H-like domain-containing protein [Acidobacteriota bacterium]
MESDKLSRLAALRPASRAQLGTCASASSSSSERLSQLLDAECVTNHLGSHIVVKRWFADPQPSNPSVFRLLAPELTAEAVDFNQWVFLDTETTGLAGGTGTYAFLVGLAWWADGGLTVEQFFMRNHGEEPSLLHELTRKLFGRRVLVTFNGKSFDWPLLETRYRMTRSAQVACPKIHLDLLHPARQLWRFRLKSVALANLERHVLAVDRGYDIPSETIPGRYFDFLRGGPAEPVAEVFHHNQMDLRGLAALAVHIAGLLARPDTEACDGGELYGISKLQRKHGEVLEAKNTLERALACGLPEVAERAARGELALFAKRRRNFAGANALWESLLGDSSDGLKAYEQLAIYYEHHAREPLRAAVLAREALVRLREAAHAGRIPASTYRSWHGRFQKRLNRLAKKTNPR